MIGLSRKLVIAVAFLSVLLSALCGPHASEIPDRLAIVQLLRDGELDAILLSEEEPELDDLGGLLERLRDQLQAE